VFCSLIKTKRESAPVIGKTFALPLLLALLLSSVLFLADTAGAQPAQGLDPSSFRLVGTIMAEGLIGAVIVDAKGEQTFYRLNEHLQEGSKLVGVRSDSILLERGDNTVYEIFIAHDTKTGVPQASPPPNAIPVTPEAAPERAVRQEPRPQKRIHNRRLSPKEE
jgi:type II secretory pathway component PulC